MTEENTQPDENETPNTEEPEQGEQPTGTTENQGESMFDGIESTGEESKAPEEATRPDGLEDKFWDEENNKLKTDQLLESYKHLRKKVGEKFDVPESYDLGDTQIQFPEETITAFKEAGLTQNQAVAVAQELQERLLTQVEQREAAVELKELRNHWGSGSDESFNNRLRSVFDYAAETVGDPELAKKLTRTKADVLMWEARLKQEMTQGRIELRHPEAKTMINVGSIEQRMADPRNNPNDARFEQSFYDETERLWEQLERQMKG